MTTKDIPASWFLIRHPARTLGTRQRIAMALAGLGGVGVIGALDFLTGYQITFSFFYLAPVSFCAWKGDRNIGLAVALAAGIMAMLADILIDKRTAHEVFSYWNALNRLAFFLLVALMVARIRALYAEQAALIEDLNAALADVRRLSGLLPMCSWCKKIREDTGYWKQVEDYLSEHSEAEFTHGICPGCEANMRNTLDSGSGSG